MVQSRRPFLWLLLIAGAASTVLAIGPESFGVPMPFKVFHTLVPGFKAIRDRRRGSQSPCCWRARCSRRSASLRSHGGSDPGSRSEWPFWLPALLLLELAAPLYRTVLPTDDATLAVYHALDHRPTGVVAELPIVNPGRDGGTAWAFLEAPRMTYSSLDWNDRVNGYSGSFPANYLTDADSLNTFPSPGSLATARRLKVRYLVLHTGVYAGFPQWTRAPPGAALAQLPPGATATRHGNAWLVDLGPSRG